MSWVALTFRADSEAELLALAGQMPPDMRWSGGALKWKWRGLYVAHRGPLAEVTANGESGEPVVLHPADERFHVCVVADLDEPRTTTSGGTVTLRAMLTALADTLAPYLAPWPPHVPRVGGELPEWGAP